MKASTKKMAVFMIMIAMALFIMAALASAHDHDWKGIHGEYAMTGTNICIIAPGGLTPDLKPTVAGLIQSSSREGVVTFEPHGTGSAVIFARNISLPVYPTGNLPPYSVLSPGASTAEVTFDFTYTLEKDGTITMVAGPGPYSSTTLTGPDAGKTFYITGASFNGVITPDRKTITLNAGAPDVYGITQKDNPSFNAQSICHFSSVLICTRGHACDRD